MEFEGFGELMQPKASKANIKNAVKRRIDIIAVIHQKILNCNRKKIFLIKLFFKKVLQGAGFEPAKALSHRIS